MVTDRQGRPVTDLTADDFEVLEEGRPQPIELFRRVDLVNQPPPDAGRPSTIRTVADEEAEAAREDVRLFAFFLDDYHVRRNHAVSIREPLVRFIRTQLQPTDMIAVMYPLTPIEEVLFTRDHESVIRTIQGFHGRKYDYTPMNTFEHNYVRASTMDIERIRNAVVIDALTALATRLGGLREGRTSIVYVSEGFVTYLPSQMRRPAGLALAPSDPCGVSSLCAGDGTMDDDLTTIGAETELLQRMRDVFVAANRSNVAIYGLDPRGSTSIEFDVTDGGGQVSNEANRRAIRTTQDSLRTISAETHGRAIVNTNSLDAGLSQMLLDSSAYYLLGYTTGVPADGRFHRITVRVQRRNVDVRARRGFWAASEAAIRRAERVAPEVAAPVQQALASIANAPRGERFVRTWLGIEPGEGGRARVRLVWEPMPAVPGERREAVSGVSVLAFGAGGDELFQADVPEDAAGSGRAGPRQAVFDAPPGRVDVRLTVRGDGGGTLDEDSSVIEVPDLGVPDVRLSTPRVYRARTAREVQTIAADGAAVPVAAREFSRSERLLIRFDAIGAGGQPIEPSAALLNRNGQTIVELPVVPAGAGGTHQLDLGLSGVPAGEYLVQITVEAAGETATELVAIRIGS
jgi:VWFA-related protein